ncbi:hypothetical protein D8O01_19615 [Acinetobacter baumannii]|nr:hypothetical protein D8O01_19615 [Acinetobacter baumannii]
MNPSLNAFRPGRLLVAASLTASLLRVSATEGRRNRRLPLWNGPHNPDGRSRGMKIPYRACGLFQFSVARSAQYFGSAQQDA